VEETKPRVIVEVVLQEAVLREIVDHRDFELVAQKLAHYIRTDESRAAERKHSSHSCSFLPSSTRRANVPEMTRPVKRAFCLREPVRSASTASFRAAARRAPSAAIPARDSGCTRDRSSARRPTWQS